MDRAGTTAPSGTETRRRGGGRATLALGGLAVLLTLGVVYGGALLNPSGEPAKPLKIHAKAGAPWGARRPRPPIVALLNGIPLDPVASALAPEGAAGQPPRIAASLIGPAAIPTADAGAESEGEMTGDTRDTDSGGAPPAVQVAALTPMMGAVRDRLLAALPLPESPPVVPIPWRAYAEPFDRGDRRPRIALVVAGIDDNMDQAIDRLPPAVTLALDPYARRLPEWIALARAKGHEVLLTLSMPAINRGRHDAGPMAILSSLDPRENLERLDWALDRTAGFVGVLDIIGHRPIGEAGPILTRLRQHGLMLVSGTEAGNGRAGLPIAIGDAVVTPDMSRRDRQAALDAVEDKVARDGHALAIAVVSPENLGQVTAWLARLHDREIALAPATALIGALPSAGMARAGIAGE